MADDDPDDRAIIEDALAEFNAGDVVQFANDGAHLMQLLNVAFTATTYPRLIVLDLNMPKLNGTQTLQQLKQDARFRHIPVIIYSTSINHVEKE